MVSLGSPARAEATLSKSKAVLLSSVFIVDMNCQSALQTVRSQESLELEESAEMGWFQNLRRIPELGSVFLQSSRPIINAPHKCRQFVCLCKIAGAKWCVARQIFPTKQGVACGDNEFGIFRSRAEI